MKKITLSIFTLALPLIVLSQPCLPEGIIFSTQAQIDSFQINHPNCTEIEGDVSIEGLNITNLNGLNVLISIGEWLTIGGYGTGNPALTSITGLENLTSVGEGLEIRNNNVLTSLTGLENLTFIGWDFVIIGNHGLTSLTGLDNVTSIGGVIDIWGNSTLASITGLINVTSIGGGIAIHNNEVLTSLSGLDNIDTASIVQLTFYANDYLSTCEVQSICDYLKNPSGYVGIFNNAVGCNSSEEVQDSCEANAVSVEERYILEECTVSPNPFTTSTTLTYSLDKPSNVTISIFNPQGQLIEKIEQKQSKGEQKVQWDAEGLPAGIYYFRIQAGDKIGGGKMVLMK